MWIPELAKLGAASHYPVFPNEGAVECRRHGAEDETKHNPSPQIGLFRFIQLVHSWSVFLRNWRTKVVPYSPRVASVAKIQDVTGS